MCGIVGVYYFDREHPVDRDLLVEQTNTLVHRGPDDGAVWIGPGVGLGHRRLSIIDLGGGLQPMFDVTGRYCTVFNGEIYNYRELRDELGSKGYQFRTDSDTETLINAYAEWGQDCVEHFNGMYGFAIYDRDTHDLFLARDRLGKKPLYYYRDSERIVFASELKAIVRDPMVPREIEATALADFFAMAYVPMPKTIYRQIYKLPAGHRAICKGAGPQISKYWDIDYRHVDFDTSAEKHAENLFELMSDAVRLRLRSDVPLGAFLSGGVDSSAVVGVMAGISETPVVTQSVGFDVEAFDERRYAREIAERFATDHHEQVLEPSAGHAVKQLAFFYDEPFGDSSAVPTYYLCEQTRKHVTVALSGDGGDEQFAGYDHYNGLVWTENIRSRLPALVWRAAALPLKHLFQITRYHKGALRFNRKLWLSASDNPDRNAYNHLLPQPYRYRELLDGELLDALGDYDPFESVADLYERSGTDDVMSRMQYADIKSYLCDDILVKVDRASMAHALEVRCPLLDHRIVEYSTRIPPIHKLRDEKSKLVLKQAIAHLIPTEFFERPKQGFAIPLDHWFRTALREPTEDLLFSRPGGKSRLLSPLSCKRMWFEEQRDLARHGSQFWNAMMFELWYLRYMERVDLPIEPTATMSEARPTRRQLPDLPDAPAGPQTRKF